MVGNLKNLIVLVGPTAIGKTKLAINLARYFDTHIFSADSRQFYKELNIGTAAPTEAERKLAKHFFAGNLSIHDNYNVSRYENEALKFADELFIDKDFIVVAGGSGMYIDALCKGIDDMPDFNLSIREEIEIQFQQKGIEFLREKLTQLDPEYFEIVDKDNPNRMKRAIEVCVQTGKTFTSFRVRSPRPRSFGIIKVGINRPREELFRNINLRTDAMIENGLLDEVKALLPFRDLNALNTVGYKEIFQFLDGDVTLQQAIENIKTNTRRYAKRQLTWFKRDKEIRWFLPENFDEIVDYINETGLKSHSLSASWRRCTDNIF